MPEAPSPFTPSQFTPSSTPPAGFDLAGFAPSATPPASFAGSGFDPSSTPPGVFSNVLTPLSDIAALKAIPTEEVVLDPPVVRQVIGAAPGAIQVWQLQEGDEADNPATGWARPDDFEEAANERVWRRVL